MKTRILGPFQWFALINIILAWCIGSHLMMEGERVHAELHHEIDSVRAEIRWCLK